MKRMIRAAAVTLGILCLVIAGLAVLVNANQFRPVLQSRLGSALGRAVEIGDLKLSLFSGGVRASDLSVADDPGFSRTPFLQAKTLTVGVELLPLLFSHQVNVTGITIDQPRIDLIQNAAGRWNFSSIGASKASGAAAPGGSGKSSFALSVKNIRIVNGTVTVGGMSANARPQVYSAVNVQVRSFSANSAFPFSVSVKMAGDGEAMLQGTAGPIDATDAARTPFRSTVSLKHIDVLASGFVRPAAGLGGLLTVDGNISSDGRTLRADGRVRGDHMKLARNGSPAPRPVQFDFSADQDLGKGAGALRRGDVHIGAATAQLTGTWTVHGDSRNIAMQLRGSNMSVDELESMLPALGIVLPLGSSLRGGTAQASVALTGPLDGLITSGAVGVTHTKLTGYDLGSRIKGIAKIAGIRTAPDTDIESFTANVRVAPEGTTVDSLMLTAPALGDLSGSGSVSPTHTLAFRMLAKMHTSGLLVLGQHGDLGVPFLVTGTASSPVFAPDVKGIAASEVKAVLKSNEVSEGVQKLFQAISGKKKPQ
ncbi:MAG TPA: AsmA family protein [Bryobacteraceae bacterium]|nr:AsmA family protein [Bryobacteraceae bacterium]